MFKDFKYRKARQSELPACKHIEDEGYRNVETIPYVAFKVDVPPTDKDGSEKAVRDFLESMSFVGETDSEANLLEAVITTGDKESDSPW